MKRLLTLLSLCVAACSEDARIQSAAPSHASHASDSTDIVDSLKDVASSVEEMSSQESGVRWFKLSFTQTLDARNEAAGTYEQVALLRHVDQAAPMVMYTSGYGIYPKPQDAHELTTHLGANQLIVEHRFFGGSKPRPTPWQTMSIEQAAADHHHIVAALKPLYPAKWVTTGSSKDGMTAVFHRRFYPDDVDATVAYVAPLSYSTNDLRYEAFLENAGTEHCRRRITGAQHALLARRDEVEAAVQQLADRFGISFARLSLDECYEHAVQELRFGTFQYHDIEECIALPDANAELPALVKAVLRGAGLFDICSDQSLDYYDGYSYQTAAQLGAYGPLELHLQGLLRYPGTYRIETYTPMAQSFDYAAMPDVQAWLASNAERVMLIYGEDDPWTAGAMQLNDGHDTLRFFAPGANHGAEIASLIETDRTAAWLALDRWMGQPLPPTPSERSSAGHAINYGELWKRSLFSATLQP